MVQTSCSFWPPQRMLMVLRVATNDQRDSTHMYTRKPETTNAVESNVARVMPLWENGQLRRKYQHASPASTATAVITVRAMYLAWSLGMGGTAPSLHGLFSSPAYSWQSCRRLSSLALHNGLITATSQVMRATAYERENRTFFSPFSPNVCCGRLFRAELISYESVVRTRAQPETVVDAMMATLSYVPIHSLRCMWRTRPVIHRAIVKANWD